MSRTRTISRAEHRERDHVALRGQRVRDPYEGVVDEQRWGSRDVRRLVARLSRIAARRPLRVSDVAWGQLYHAYGRATDVPRLLARLGDRDAEVAGLALGELGNSLRHQGGTSMAAPLAVPYLLRLARDTAIHNRRRLLYLAAEIGRRNHFGRDTRAGLLRCAEEGPRYDTHGYPGHWSIQAGRDALAADAAILLGLLTDPDDQVRCHAAYALAASSRGEDRIIRGLRERLPVEAVPLVRVSLVLAIAQLAGEHDHELVATLDWAQTLWADAAAPSYLRLGAGIAWLCLTDAPPPPDLLDVLGAVSESMTWMRDLPWPDAIDEHGGLGAWLAGLLDDTPTQQIELARRWAAGPHPSTRGLACRAAYDIAARWRQHTDDAVTILAGLLTEPDGYVAVMAACLLSRVGDATVTVVDDLAAALGRHDGVSAWAALALAHCRDPRAVAPLDELLRAPVNPWAEWTTGAGLRLLDGMRPYAASLCAAVAYRLARPEFGWQPVVEDLALGLGDWATAASGMVPALAQCLDQGTVGPDLIITTLGRIGPAAAAAIPVLDAIIPAGAEQAALVVWARWRITGDHAADTAATLAKTAQLPGLTCRTLPLLADLGPGAGTHTALLRCWLDDQDSVIRVEAAYALWRVTGDATEAVPVLVREATCPHRPFPRSVCAVAAVGYLTQIGSPAAAAILPTLHAFLTAPQREPDSYSEWATIPKDQDAQRVARDAIDALTPHPGNTCDGEDRP